MAQTATIYRLEVDLSDVPRGVYETLSFRVAQHPSEGEERLVARILAYILLYEEGLEFGRGLSDAEEPALWRHDLTGQLLHWVDVGTPSADRLHLATKKAPRVTVVCHKPIIALARETEKRALHRAEEVEVILLEPALVTSLARSLGRKCEWALVHTDGNVNISVGEENFSGGVSHVALPQ